MPLDLERINETSDILNSADSWYPPNKAGQKTLKQNAKNARLEELKKALPEENVIFWGDRSTKENECAVYVTEPSGKVKICDRCKTYLLEWHPINDELVCTDCGETKKSRGMSSLDADKKSSKKSTSTNKSFINLLDATFIKPETRDNKLSESGTETKYEYLQEKIISIANALELEIGSKAWQKLMVDSSTRYRKKKEFEIKSASLREELIKLNESIDLTIKLIQLQLGKEINLDAILQDESIQKEHQPLYLMIKTYVDKRKEIYEKLEELKK